MSKYMDLTDRQFTRLQVERFFGRKESPSGRSDILWLCRCDCGAEVVVRGNNLRSGATRSCGCLHRELASKMARNRRGGVKAVE